jgi:hypothetical protein
MKRFFYYLFAFALLILALYRLGGEETKLSTIREEKTKKIVGADDVSKRYVTPVY